VGLDQGVETRIADVRVPQANHRRAVGVERCGADGVASPLFRGVVIAAVQLDHEPQLGTVEVDDVAGDGMLAPEL